MRLFALAFDLLETFFDDKIGRHFSNMAAITWPSPTASTANMASRPRSAPAGRGRTPRSFSSRARKIAFAIKVMNERGIVSSGDAPKLGIGAMADARWKSFYDTMAAAGAVAPGIDVSKAYSLAFIIKGVGAA